MRHPDIDYMMVMERRRDELAEAANQRLVKEAEAANRLNPARPQRAFKSRVLVDALMLAFARVLSFAGERMLTWSCRLNSRYQVLVEGGPEKQPSPCS